MQHADGRRRFQARDDVQNGFDRVGHGHGPFLLHALLQRAPGDQLHRDHRLAFHLFGAENIDAVWMIDRGGEAAFAEESLPGILGIERLRQNLQGHPAAALRFLRFVNRAHSALP